jgi:predicted alpha/beta hydrolase family esterase
VSYVLIHHGWTNTRPPGHWQRNLAVALRAQGHHVSYAQYPETQLPGFDTWSELLVAELELLVELRQANGGDGELVLVGHSLGCVNIMKSALNGLLRPELKANRTLFVAPAALETLDRVESFKFGLATADEQAALRASLAKAAGEITIVASDADEWLPRGIGKSYSDPLELEPVIFAGAKHLSLTDGWGQWQGVIDWVNDPTADLRVR